MTPTYLTASAELFCLPCGESEMNISDNLTASLHLIKLSL